MFRLLVLLVLVACPVLYFTNPGPEAHRKAVIETMAAQQKHGVLGKLAADLFGNADAIPLKYSNYQLCSMTTLDGKTISFGLLSKIWQFQHENRESR